MSVQDYDGYLHLYENAFDPLNQLVNLLAGNDDDAGGIGTSGILGITLNPGTDYYLITSAFSAGEAGSFTNTITGPGTVSCPAAGPPLPAVPTLSEWGLIVLGLLTLIIGTVAVMRKREQVA